MAEKQENEIEDCIEGLDPHRKITITSEMKKDKSYDNGKNIRDMED